MIAARNETGRRFAAAPGAADWLGLAAAPTFAVMALLTSVSGDGADMICATMRDASPFGGMVPMYLLMVLFHAGPWFRLISRIRANWRRRDDCPARPRSLSL